MKITIKTLQQKIFQVFLIPITPWISCSPAAQIEAEGEDTVADVKKRIEDSQGHRVADQKLIYSGQKWQILLTCVQ